jgi:hypothetical protein
MALPAGRSNHETRFFDLKLKPVRVPGHIRGKCGGYEQAAEGVHQLLLSRII